MSSALKAVRKSLSLLLSMDTLLARKGMCKASFDDATGYLADDALDFLDFLPPYPALNSAEDAADLVQLYQWLSLDPERAELAKADTELSYQKFQTAFGEEISDIRTPFLLHLLDRVEASMSPALNSAKAHYYRPRPYQRLRLEGFRIFEHVSPQGASFIGGSSYPSGHATFGWAVALALAQIAPKRTPELLLRGREYGESRIVCGVHYPSDIRAAELMVNVIWECLQSAPEFRSDLLCAQEEHSALRRERIRP